MGFESMDAFIEHLEPMAREAVTDFIDFMKMQCPELAPRITYSMPMWWFGRKIYDGYIAVSAASKHYSVHFPEDAYIMELKEELPGCTFGKRCVNIKYGDENTLVIVKNKVKECIKRMKND